MGTSPSLMTKRGCASFWSVSQPRIESGRKAPWQIMDAPVDYIARQMRAIVGFSLRVNSLQGQWKLSQNKDQADHGGVMRGLEDDGAHDILSWSSERTKSAKTNP